MKYFLVVMFLFFATQLYASDSVYVSKNDLKDEAKEKIEKKEKVEAVSSWIGIGKELGIAMNEAMKATIDNADKFGRTNVGTFIFVVLGIKFIGKPIVIILLMFVLFGLGNFIILKSYWRNCMVYKYLVKESFDEKGKSVKEYALHDPEKNESKDVYHTSFVRWGHVGVYSIMLGFMCILLACI